MVEDKSDDDLRRLSRGGHDYRKVYAAFQAAREHTGQPTVILAKTIKGWTLESFEGRNATHQMKKLTNADLKAFRDRLYLPITDAALDADLPPYYHPGEKSDEIQYMKERRAALGGYLPKRVVRSKPLPQPADTVYDELRAGSGKHQIATTQAIVRLFKDLMKDPEIGKLFVPIIPDEARTFGLDAIFPTAKIYSPHGQEYEAVDRELLLSYKESKTGQILHEGISEAGSTASLIAASTAYATHGAADDPVLHLLLDVRVPAHRRPVLAAGRPARPRVRLRRHRRPHHADRRGAAARRRPLAAARLDQPGRGRLRPGVRLRDRPHHQGRAAADVRPGLLCGRSRERLLLPDRLQRADHPAGRAREPRCRGAAARPVPATARPWASPAGRGRGCSPRASRCRGRSRPSSCSATSGTSTSTSGR